jgi:hypothetical protein
MTRWLTVLGFLPLVVFAAHGLGSGTAAGGMKTHWCSQPRPSHSSPCFIDTSKVWSGYVLGPGRYASVSASWVQPKVKCSATPTAFSKFWVGLDGYFQEGMGTVEQTGTNANCLEGTATYTAWYELWPKREVLYPNHVDSGDRMSASVTTDGKGHFTLLLADRTLRWSHRASATVKKAGRTSAEVIVEYPAAHQAYPGGLADFGTVSFTHAVANGTSFSYGIPELTRVNMSSHGERKATASPMSKGAFTVTWKHS